MITEFSDIVKEGSNHIIFKTKVRHFIVCVTLGWFWSDNFVKEISNWFFLLTTCTSVNSFSWENSASTIMMTVVMLSTYRCILAVCMWSSILMSTSNMLSTTWGSNFSNWWRPQLLLWMHTWKLFLSSDLCNTLVHGSDIDIHDLDSLVVINL